MIKVSIFFSGLKALKILTFLRSGENEFRLHDSIWELFVPKPSAFNKSFCLAFFKKQVGLGKAQGLDFF
ncbi:MAG: hypothetical protein AB7E42_03860 [Anaerotignaceae bacterium]